MKRNFWYKLAQKEMQDCMKEIEVFFKKHPSAKNKKRRIAMADLLNDGKASTLESAWRKTAGVR